jgi:hypothetical protein
MKEQGFAENGDGFTGSFVIVLGGVLEGFDVSIRGGGGERVWQFDPRRADSQSLTDRGGPEMATGWRDLILSGLGLVFMMFLGVEL